jgi:WD40 repeat protein
MRCCFPKKNAAPPNVKVDAGEPADDSFDPTVYLLNVQVDPLGEKLAVSTSNNEIKVYGLDNMALVGQLSGHTNSVTDIKFSLEEPHLLASSGSDGMVAVWDVRSGAQVSAYKVPTEAFSSVAIAGDVLAAGTNSGCVGFWDLRTGSHQVLKDYFSEEVSQLSFHPTSRNILFAGSFDGLVNQIDCSVELGDDAIIDVLNVGTSVSKMGFFGPQDHLFFTLAPTEQLQIWNVASSTKIADFGFDLLQVLSNLTSGDTVNYIIDCKYDGPNDVLLIFAGSFTGSIFVFACLGSDFQFLAKLNGHTAIVRSVYFDSAATHSAFTVGEDSMLFYWSASNADGSASPSSKPTASPSFSASQRTKPY